MSTWRATVIHCRWFIWRIEFGHYRPGLLGDGWMTYTREDGGPYAWGTERLVRRRIRSDEREAEARRNAVTIGNTGHVVIHQSRKPSERPAPQPPRGVVHHPTFPDDWEPPSAALIPEPDPTRDQHQAYP